jgi:hypothetical protein
MDAPTEKLRWNMESLRAAEAADTDPRASSLLPTVLANIGFSQLLMANPVETRAWYQRALASLEAAHLADERRAGSRGGIEHMLTVIDGANASSL